MRPPWIRSRAKCQLILYLWVAEMKKFLVVCAACLLSCFLVRAQEADDAGRSVGLSVIPRFDLNPIFSTEKGGSGEFTLGDSSLYTLLEGNLSDSFSFSIANHWLAYDKESIQALYQNTWRSDDVNWLDWAYLTFETNGWSLTAGKQPMTVGSFEFDEYDFEVPSFLCSTVWNSMNVYQWGAKAGWTNPAENTSISLQMTTSPFGERPFSSKLFNYSAEWRGTYGAFENIWSVTAVQRAPGDFLPVLTLGQRYTIADMTTFALDCFSVVGDEFEILQKGVTLNGSVTVAPSERLSVTGRIIAESNSETGNKDLVVGMSGFWFPLKNNDSLRLHASAGWRHDWNQVSLTVGALYYLNIPIRK